jgi:hypothetical protein
MHSEKRYDLRSLNLETATYFRWKESISCLDIERIKGSLRPGV